MNHNFISIINLNNINYYIKSGSNINSWIFYIKNEFGNFNYVGDEENERLNQLIYIDPKKVYFRNKINIKALSILLGLNITLTSLTGCAIKKEDFEKIDNLPNINIEQIIEQIPEQKDIFEEEIIEHENKEITPETDIEITKQESIEDQEINLPSITEQTIDIKPEIIENNQEETLKQTWNNIEKYNMRLYQDIILVNQELFNHMCSVIEANENIPSYAKMIGVQTFPRLMLAKNYINFDNYFEKLSILNYLERDPEPDEKKFAGYYTNFSTKGNIPEIVILNMTTRDSTIYHEFEHFNGSRKDYSSYVNVTFQNDKFVNDIYGEHYPVHGRLFEEGLVSSFTQDIGYIDSYSYPNDQKVVDIYTYIFGPELMLEAHQSDGKINVLLNAVLELGFTKEEVLDIFLRLDLYHQLMYIYDDGNVNLDFLSYQIIDNLTQIYEKKYHKPFTEDQTFCLLIDAFLNIEKGYNIESELLDSGYIAYSKELLDIINSQESLIETYFPPELYFDHSFKIFSINIESQFFSTLEKNTKIEVILTDNPGQQIGEYQMIFLTFDYKENKLILRNISMENTKFVHIFNQKKKK